MLTNGHYHTRAGSTVTVSGPHSGIFEVAFDWLEEPNACFDCRVNPVPVDGWLTWHCDRCGSGSAELIEIAEA
jgi:hypothetical protein